MVNNTFLAVSGPCVVGAWERGSRGSNEPPLQVNDGGLKTQAFNFQLFIVNSGGMENKL